MADRRPNILFISVDQQRWDCLGFNDRYPVKTPQLDALASDGVCFDNSFTPFPLCAPARQALLCGRRPERFGALWNWDQGIPVASIPADAFSWAASLHDAGFRTGYIGSWHVSPTLTPRDFGYESYVPTTELHRYMREKNPGLGFRKGFFGEVSPFPYEDCPPHHAAALVNDLIDEYGDQPWHIKMDLSEPHLPCRPSEPFASMYGDVPQWASFDDPLTDKPYIHRQMRVNWHTEDMTWDDLRETARLYYAVISQIDDAVGRVLAHLRETGQYDNTVVIFTADHGDMCGDRHMMDKHYILYDEVTRVPLVMRGPGITPGRSRALVMNMLDLVPTILELCGCAVPDGLDGQSLVPYLRDPTLPGRRKYVLSTYNGQQFGLYTQRMIRDEHRKYVWNLTDVDELYDLDADPHELHNLVHDPARADELAALRRDMLTELDAVGDYTAKSGWLRDQLANSRKL